ncbi:cAMP-binding domain of CRP or a regulatory subunit of cAMP-dependent protein kinases [Chryseobacterium oleae]|uniref:cAMP-binding domain of CRP or a regulatory subunit of cAMP-dependent protein kinases n=1 Tax=Chryseobacterium oleae TaxID=491207 RepID=A0A1I4YRX9_CHROL|nr:Crp/Fnr family transcriptional regulator [Chryseobacterium oleae]SFN40737.1 cAMP-binding domain of CRP or a regulatory subunit of cAMP-dependent protein kinases [Chryseobacterium oleae]
MKDNTNEHKEKGLLFQLDEEHYNELSSYLIEIKYKKNQFLLKEGDFCKHVGFLKKGVVRSYYLNDNGCEINFNFYFDNHLFSDYESFLCNMDSKINIQAMEDSDILLLSKHDLETLYQKEDYWREFGRKITGIMYFETKKRFEDLLYLSPEQRYNNLFSEYPKIFQSIALKHIASYLGIKPQSLSRIRSRSIKR